MWRYLPGVKCPETPSSATKRPKLTPTYSDSEEQETDRVKRHFVGTWNTWLVSYTNHVFQG